LTQSDPSEVLRAVLADPEFDTDWQEHLARWLGQAWRSFQHWLRHLPDLERWALLLACVAILAWLVWTMIASYREMMAPDASALKGAGEAAAKLPTWQALMAHARALASEGRVREAARALQQAVYSVLASRKRLAWDGARADWEWVARLGTGPEAGPELAAFTEQAQAIAYGGAGADSGGTRFESLLATADRWMRP